MVWICRTVPSGRTIRYSSLAAAGRLFRILGQAGLDALEVVRMRVARTNSPGLSGGSSGSRPTMR
jgi:hypothetical protein